MGTRANTKACSTYHAQRSLLIIEHKETTIWLDCAQMWEGKLSTIEQQPDAICISHAHDDHVRGLRSGAPAPVYASSHTWDIIDFYDIPQSQRHVIAMQESFTIGSITVTPYNIYHSLLAPANAYKITTDACTLLYAADLAGVENPQEAFDDVDIYIGDGSIVDRTMLQHEEDGQLVGHAPISQQITWCADHGVHHAIFTHCGAEIINQDFHTVEKQIRDMGQEHDIYATIAYDGLQTTCQELLAHKP